MKPWPCNSSRPRPQERAAATNDATPSALVVAASSARSPVSLGSMLDEILAERPPADYAPQRFQAAELFGLHARFVSHLAETAADAVAGGAGPDEVGEAVMEAGRFEAVAARARAAAMDAVFADVAWSFDRAVEKGDL